MARWKFAKDAPPAMTILFAKTLEGLIIPTSTAERQA